MITSGEALCSIALTEPDFDPGVASLSRKGPRADDGWLLDGAKNVVHLCEHGEPADGGYPHGPRPVGRTLGLLIMLVAKPSGDAHDFGFRYPGGGRLTERSIPTIGYRGMHSFDLHFDRVFVPDTHVLGKCFYYTMRGMTGGRMQTAARAVEIGLKRQWCPKPAVAYPAVKRKLC